MLQTVGFHQRTHRADSLMPLVTNTSTPTGLTRTLWLLISLHISSHLSENCKFQSSAFQVLGSESQLPVKATTHKGRPIAPWMPAADTPDVEDGFLSQSSGQEASDLSIHTETLSPRHHQMWDSWDSNNRNFLSLRSAISLQVHFL